MMHDARIARSKFERAHQAVCAQPRGDHEISVDVGTVGRNLKLVRHRDHEIGLSQLPSGRELRARRQIGRIAARGSISHPGHNPLDLVGIETAFVEKSAESLPGPPGGHDPLFDHRRNLRRPVTHVFIRRQRKRRGLTLAVATQAVGKDDRRNVATVSQLLRCDIGIHRFDQAADRLRSRKTHIAAGADGSQHVSQIPACHLRAGTADSLIAVVDPAAIDDDTVAIDDDHLWRMRRSQLPTQAPGSIQQERIGHLI